MFIVIIFFQLITLSMCVLESEMYNNFFYPHIKFLITNYTEEVTMATVFVTVSQKAIHSGIHISSRLNQS